MSGKVSRWLIVCVAALLLVWGAGSAFAATRPASRTRPQLTHTHAGSSGRFGSFAAPTIGELFTATTGTWTNSPTSFAYVWQRCSGSGGTGCSSIAGATSSTYTLVSADAGGYVRVGVAASNASGTSGFSFSSVSGLVSTAGTAPSNTVAPSVSGTAISGSVLTATNGSWTGSPTSYSYVWQRCTGSGGTGCTSISGATLSAYTLVSGDIGNYVRVGVAATNASGTSALSFSTVSGQVTGPPPSNTAVPSVSGAATVSSTLTSTTGTWTDSPTSYSYVWQDCNAAATSCAAISGATASTYTVTSSDVGFYVQVGVTATNAFGTSGQSFSSVTALVAGGSPPTVTLDPVVSGSTVVGSTLTTTTGTWTGSPTSYSYQWTEQNPCGPGAGTRITGATNNSYTLVSGDTGFQLYVIVTATNAYGSTADYSSCTPAVTSNASSCNKYAAPSGSDAAAGTSGAPYATVQKLETSLTAGQTGCLNAGTYGGITTYNDLTASGTSGNPITLTATPGAATTPIVVGWTIIDHANYVTLTGLKIDIKNTFYPQSSFTGQNASCAPGGAGAQALEVEGSNDTIIHDNIYSSVAAPSNQAGQGIGVGFNGAGYGDNTVIAYNKIHDVGSCDAFDPNIYVSHGASGQIYDNWMWNNAHGYGIQLYPSPSNTNIYSNVIDTVGAGMSLYSSGTGSSITHNVVSNSTGIVSADAGSSYAGAFAFCGGQAATVSNNDSFSNSGGTLGSGCPGAATFTSTLTVNPTYTSQSAHNYTVGNSSLTSWGLWDGSGTP